MKKKKIIDIVISILFLLAVIAIQTYINRKNLFIANYVIDFYFIVLIFVIAITSYFMKLKDTKKINFTNRIFEYILVGFIMMQIFFLGIILLPSDYLDGIFQSQSKGLLWIMILTIVTVKTLKYFHALAKIIITLINDFFRYDRKKTK